MNGIESVFQGGYGDPCEGWVSRVRMEEMENAWWMPRGYLTENKAELVQKEVDYILKNADDLFRENQRLFYNNPYISVQPEAPEAVKISRREYPFLKFSYTLTRDSKTKELQVFQHFHGRDIGGQKKGFLGQGVYKIVLEMKNMTGGEDAVRAQLTTERVDDNLKQFIKELADAKYVLIPKYMKWRSRKSGVVKEALISVKMDIESTVLMQKRIRLAQKRHVLWQIAKGVQEMHAKNWIHHDLKVENILIKNNAIKIADLDMVEKMEEGKILSNDGTPMFKAPEMFFRKVSTVEEAKKTDIYSLGALCYEILKKKQFPVYLITQGAMVVSVLDGNERDKIFPEPSDKKTYRYLIWKMVRYDSNERPNIVQVVKFMEHDFTALD